jgi:hypothetical protein
MSTFTFTLCRYEFAGRLVGLGKLHGLTPMFELPNLNKEIEKTMGWNSYWNSFWYSGKVDAVRALQRGISAFEVKIAEKGEMADPSIQ